MATVRVWAVLILSVLSGTAVAGEMLVAGASFPGWELSDHNGVTVASKDLAGQTYLLWFYPRAMTPGCTAEGQGLRDRYADFQKAGVRIFGVSFDAPAANAQFVKQEGFPFPLLSDTTRELAAVVGAAESREQAAAKRISYLVGGDGKVLKSYATVDPQRHAQEVLADLEQQK